MVSWIRFLCACPFLGAAMVLVKVGTTIFPNVTKDSNGLIQLASFCLAAACLVFSMIGLKIAGNQPVGSVRRDFLVDEFSK